MNQTTEDTRSLPTVIIQTVSFVIMTVLSLAENLLVCLAFYRNRRLRTVTNFFVFSLAITDIISATFEYSFNTVAFGLRKWPFGVNFCQFNGFFAYYWDVVTMSILALTAVNRYFCEVKPRFYSSFFTKKKTVFLILSLLLFTLTVSLTITLVTPVMFRWHYHYLFCQLKDVQDFAQKRAQLSHLLLDLLPYRCA